MCLPQLVRKTPEPLDFSVLLHKLRKELQSKDPIVRQQSLSWVSMLLEKNEGQVLSVLEDFWYAQYLRRDCCLLRLCARNTSYTV